MADKEEGHDPMQEVWFIVGLLVVLLVLWYAQGGPSRADLRGIFLQPLPPLGSGQSYGPDPFSSSSQNAAGAQNQPQNYPQTQQ